MIKWKKHNGVHYAVMHGKCGGSDYLELQVHKQTIAGTNFRGAHHSKTPYYATLTDGYDYIQTKFHIMGLLPAKEYALKIYNDYLEKQGVLIFKEAVS